jgi:CRP-like cAMP-binding protein
VEQKDYPFDRVRRLLSGVPFFNQLLRQDEPQFQQLVGRLELLQARSGETVIRQGETDRGLYFLLRGELEVWGNGDKTPLYRISAGEVFGTLAMLREAARSATLTVPDSCKEALLARLDYELFSDIGDNRRFTLATKLSFYRMIVHNIRWALEMNRTQSPHHPLVSEMLKMPLFVGARDTEEELVALRDQAHRLADILYRWNESADE